MADDEEKMGKEEAADLGRRDALNGNGRKPYSRITLEQAYNDAYNSVIEEAKVKNEPSGPTNEPLPE